jgi:O-antigen/teichoic acid export membrane protein
MGEQVALLGTTAISAYLLTRELGPASYGAFVGIYNLMSPFLAFIQSGVSLSVMERIVRERHDPEQVAGAYLGYVFVGGLVLWAVVSGFAGLFIHGVPISAAVMFVASDLLVVGTINVTTATIQATAGYKPAAQVRIILSVVRSCVLIGLAVTGRLHLTQLAAAQLVSFAVVAVLVHRWHERLARIPLRPRRFSLAEVKGSAVYAVGISALTTQNGYDQVVLNSSTSSTDPVPGRYAAGYRMVSLGLMPLAAIANATHTDFLTVGDGHNDQERRAAKFARFGLVYSIVFCVAAFVGAPLVPKILGEEYRESVTVIRLLLPLIPLRGISTFPLNGLLGLGRIGVRTKLLVISAVLSLGSYLVLIPRMSWRGAVLGTVLSESFLFIAAWTAFFVCQASEDASIGHQRS